MKRKIYLFIQLIMLPTFMLVGLALPVNAVSCTPSSGSGGIAGGLLEITPWYKYLPGELDSEGKCRAELPKSGGKIDIAKSATLIIVAVIELLTRVAGLIAAGFVIYGSIQYITSQGEPEGIANAKNTIINALIGFVIVMLAIAVVQFTGRLFS